MRARRVISLLAMSTFASIIISMEPSVAFADSGDQVTASEVAAALRDTEDASESLIAEPIATKTDTDSAAEATILNGTIDVPKDPDEGVELAVSDVSSVVVSLPNAEDAADAKKLTDGAIVYPSKNGAANAVLPTEDGVQMLTIIANSSAPTRYNYKVDVPDGGEITLIDGGALVTDAVGNPIMAVSAAWAKDANGTEVQSHFETDGMILTQVVEHAGASYAYPVVADPWWSMVVGLVSVTAKKIGPWAWALCLTGAGWGWYRSDASGWVRVGDAAAGCFL